MKRSVLTMLFVLGSAFILGKPIDAVAVLQQLPPAATIKQPGDSNIVPDKFLRRWDPVTIFFDSDIGPQQAAPEDHPQRFVSMQPRQPGAYTWLNAHTLQFRPTQAWPPLTKFHWRVDGKTYVLNTLMSAPQAVVPADGAEGLDPVETIRLTFNEPLDSDALARMVTIELRPLPGVEAGESRWLEQKDFKIKVIERSQPNEAVHYVLLLNQPIASGMRAIVHLRLSLDDSIEQAFKRISFTTAEPFRVLRMGCSNNHFPVTPAGIKYTQEQAIQCDTNQREISVDFSARPKQLGPVAARNLLRFTPAVSDLHFEVAGKSLQVRGKFATDVLYRVNLVPTSLRDARDRRLDQHGSSELYIYFPPKRAFLNWKASAGILERYGPQMMPIRGRGDERLDVRISPVDPLDRSFWPFPNQAVAVDETQRPPAPGERAEPFTETNRSISQGELINQIRSLGSPAYSRIVKLPLKHSGAGASFGLDLQSALATINGKHKPGHYLVGIRRLDGSSDRSWVRVQVTDLSLTAVEETAGVKFSVTSLATGKPIADAVIRIEGVCGRDWETVMTGTTDRHGFYHWPAPGYQGRRYTRVRRISVRKGKDVIVIDPAQGPDEYRNNHWAHSGNTWLQWTVARLSARKPQPENLCHIFTERPIYKPDELVHIKAYIRRRQANGEFNIPHLTGELVVVGPGQREWRYPVVTGDRGSVYVKFKEDKLPTGYYQAFLEFKKIGRCGEVSFQKESYRIPKFEVQLHSADKVSLDKKFTVTLTSKYYAGGQVVNRPVRWRVTQYPYTWSPQARAGFVYSSDGRFSGRGAFHASPVMNVEAKTDDSGAARLELDPSIEPTAQPRSYVVEATVIGADDQTVTTTRQIHALPPLVLGIKAPRYLERARQISPEIIAVGADGKLIANQKIKLRLLKRQWHSHLQATDFSQGEAKYVTNVVDETVLEKTLQSGKKPIHVKLPIASAGVYIIELVAHDEMGRAQVVSVDLYAGGDEPVTWSRPPTKIFKVTSDKRHYQPGEVAKLILESPYQTARALAIVEAPAGNRYAWVNVHGGAASFKVPLLKTYTPRIPVHFILMRGRIGDKRLAATQLDLGKPATVAATKWLEITPVEHIVQVKLDAPAKALPGQNIHVKIQLRDQHGRPLAGEVTLWLVDQAVLALGKEQRLDPLPDFIHARDSRLTARDTRNLVVGHVPFDEEPGGGAAALEAAGKQLIDNVTVRQNFKPVPYYNPAIVVGPSGNTDITVKLADNLTNFKIRAKAISGKDRFGYAKGQIAVRLPVIVQPTLPRFVRPGDRFTATAIGRVVEGKGGPGLATVKTQGLTLSQAPSRRFAWQEQTPQRLDFPVSVPVPAYDKNGKPAYTSVEFSCAVQRDRDKARDAFKITLPIRPDRSPIIRRQIKTLQAGEALTLPEVKAAVRTGSLRRVLLLSNQPGLIKMSAGLNYLLEYPHGCTEQRLSRARAYIAMKQFRKVMQEATDQTEIDRTVRQTIEWLKGAIDDHGLVGYWPGSKGYVSLTAWSLQFLLEARSAGYPVDDALLDKLIQTLKASLRSDYHYFITGEDYTERSMALWALASAGAGNRAYAAELARKTNYLNLESTALVVRALNKDVGKVAKPTLDKLITRLWNGLVFRLYQGKEVYGGLQKTASARNALILPSETRTIADILAALQQTQRDNPRMQKLIDALVTLGQQDGWGSTNANVSALLALSAVMTGAEDQHATAQQQLAVTLNGDEQSVTLDSVHPLDKQVSIRNGVAQIHYVQGDKPVSVSTELRYLPVADGSQVKPTSQGFLVKRELLKLVGAGQPLVHQSIGEGGQQVALQVGDVIEEHIEVVNPDDRTYVAVVVPLAAGMEVMNPHLATASADAKPQGNLTLAPSYAAYLDDKVAFYYDSLPKGNYEFYFRSRATVAGEFIQPAAYAEMMYQQAVTGNSAGARIVISPAKTSQ
jgi:uncharacterized protein YfaS (alpha-2-macroglobulin family)